MDDWPLDYSAKAEYQEAADAAFARAAVTLRQRSTVRIGAALAALGAAYRRRERPNSPAWSQRIATGASVSMVETVAFETDELRASADAVPGLSLPPNDRAPTPAEPQKSPWRVAGPVSATARVDELREACSHP